MPRRHILTERQRSALLDLPTDEQSLLQHYTLANDDLELIRERRRPENRMRFALQLCAFRYPGRLLYPGELKTLDQVRISHNDLSKNAAGHRQSFPVPRVT